MLHPEMHGGVNGIDLERLPFRGGGYLRHGLRRRYKCDGDEEEDQQS